MMVLWFLQQPLHETFSEAMRRSLNSGIGFQMCHRAHLDVYDSE